jgi:hypothetical protein
MKRTIKRFDDDAAKPFETGKSGSAPQGARLKATEIMRIANDLAQIALAT